MKSIRDLKRGAREALSGNYGGLIPAVLATFGLNLIGSMLTSTLFPGYATISIVLSQIFSIILSLVFSIFTAGFTYMVLQVARGKQCSVRDLLYFFKNHPDRVITATIVLAVIDVIANIPVTYYNFMVEIGSTMEAQMEWLGNYGILLLITSVLNILLTIPFAMIYYLLSDNEEMGGMEAVKASARIMKGRMGKYLLLQISFVPLLLLSVFTMYIALLWIIPYIEMTVAMFYRDILGELDPVLTMNTEVNYGENLLSAEDTQDENQSEA